MRTKKKTAAVAVAAAVGSIAVGGAAWAWIATTGTGTATATATAEAGQVTLAGSAEISDLETPAPVTIKGTSTHKNRHITTVTVAINGNATLPGNCDPEWFQLRLGENGEFTSSVEAPAGHTFTTIVEEDVNLATDVYVQLKNVDADQSGCVGGAPLTGLLSLSAN